MTEASMFTQHRKSLEVNQIFISPSTCPPNEQGETTINFALYTQRETRDLRDNYRLGILIFRLCRASTGGVGRRDFRLKSHLVDLLIGRHVHGGNMIR